MSLVCIYEYICVAQMILRWVKGEESDEEEDEEIPNSSGAKKASL